MSLVQEKNGLATDFFFGTFADVYSFADMLASK